jgi:hypothetical protein
MEVMVLHKPRPAALEELLAGAVVPHLHFIWSSSTRVFMENCFAQFPPIHKIHELRWQALNLMTLWAGDAEEREKSGWRRRRASKRSTWTRCS